MPKEEFSSRSDKDIIDEIEEALLKEDEISTDNINFDVKNGKVTLRGAVETPEESEDLEDLVENIPGVTIVENYLTVENV